ncbi:MAG: alpha/beta hydrolase, partial [Sciscionella sp.]
TAGIPRWLADELDRAWRRHGSRLVPTMDAAARRDGPGVDELRRIGVPTGIAGCSDDPVHPAAVAAEWAGALPVSALRFVTLDTLGADRAALGRAAVLAWLRAGGRPNGVRD